MTTSATEAGHPGGPSGRRPSSASCSASSRGMPKRCDRRSRRCRTIRAIGRATTTWPIVYDPRGSVRAVRRRHAAAFFTSFDGSWDAYMDDFFNTGPTLNLFDAIFRHAEGYDGLPGHGGAQGVHPGRAADRRRLCPQLPAAPSRRSGRRSASTPRSSRCSTIRRPQRRCNIPALKPLLDEAASDVGEDRVRSHLRAAGARRPDRATSPTSTRSRVRSGRAPRRSS